jgi:hypothetical protein
MIHLEKNLYASASSDNSVIIFNAINNNMIYAHTTDDWPYGLIKIPFEIDAKRFQRCFRKT